MDMYKGKDVPQQTRKIGVTRRSVSGFFPFRGIKSIEFESTLERDFLIRAEFFLRVRDIVPQPVRIPFVSASGRHFDYTPDFWVLYNGSARPALVEVKPETEWQANWREWLPKWKAAWRYAKERGWQFHIHDESRIRDRTLENIRFLQRYRRTYFHPEQSRVLLERISNLGRVSCRTVLDSCFGDLSVRDGMALIYHLLATRQLDCDISESLIDTMNVWISDHDNQG